MSDEDTTSAGPPQSDQTVRIPQELLSILPPPSDAPPPPPGAAAPPPPPGASGSRRDYGSDGPDPDERRGGGWLWLVGALVVAVVFIAACYVVVAQAEDDRPQTATAPEGSGGETTTTTGSTTTTAPPTTRPPAELAVVVLNGSGQRGWAGENVTLLAEAGYEGEASDATSEDIETTTVYIADEALRVDGAAVATAIGLPDAPIEIRPEEPLGVTDAADTADVVVVLGADSLG